MAIYRVLEILNPELAEKFNDDRIESADAYSGIVKGLLEHFDLPIGYATIRLFLDHVTERVEAVSLTKPRRMSRPLIPTPTGNRVRPLLLKAIDSAKTTPSGSC